MSVYTSVTEAELDAWLTGHYSVGRLKALEPIKAGIENTNYFVTTTQGSYVLTQIKLDPERAHELESGFAISEEILRHLLLRKDEA